MHYLMRNALFSQKTQCFAKISSISHIMPCWYYNWGNWGPDWSKDVLMNWFFMLYFLLQIMWVYYVKTVKSVSLIFVPVAILSWGGLGSLSCSWLQLLWFLVCIYILNMLCMCTLVVLFILLLSVFWFKILLNLLYFLSKSLWFQKILSAGIWLNNWILYSKAVL